MYKNKMDLYFRSKTFLGPINSLNAMGHHLAENAPSKKIVNKSFIEIKQPNLAKLDYVD